MLFVILMVFFEGPAQAGIKKAYRCGKPERYMRVI
jgi:hypothetical protein